VIAHIDQFPGRRSPQAAELVDRSLSSINGRVEADDTPVLRRSPADSVAGVDR